MPGRKVAASIRQLGTDAAAQRLRDLLGGCIVVGNLECALCDVAPESGLKSDGSPNLHAPTCTAEWLKLAGFTVMSLANNHVLDCGPDGLSRTVQSLHMAGIQTVGAGQNIADAVRPAILSRGEKRLALLAFGNGPAAGRRSWGVAPFSSDALASALAQVPRGVEAVIVMVHVGLEFLEYPESGLREFADEALDGGADIVIGTHPHCIRGMERTGRGVILYSLGDFLADTADRQLLGAHLARTALTRLGFDAGGARNCRQGIACDIFIGTPGRIECRLRSIVADDDFLPRITTAREHHEIVERIRELSRPIRDADSPEMRLVGRIEKAYAKAYGRGRRLKDYLTLPFRLRPRHASGLMDRLVRAIGVSWER